MTNESHAAFRVTRRRRKGTRTGHCREAVRRVWRNSDGWVRGGGPAVPGGSRNARQWLDPTGSCTVAITVQHLVQVCKTLDMPGDTAS